MIVSWDSLDYTEKPEATRRMQTELSRFRTHSADILSIAAIDKNHRIIDPIYFNHESTDAFLLATGFNDFLSNAMGSWLSQPNGFPILSNNLNPANRTTITFYGVFYDRELFSTIGYIAINIRARFFFRAVDEILGNAFTSVFILNENSDIVYASGEIIYDFSSLEQVTGHGGLFQIGEKYYLAYSQLLSGYPLWRIVGLIDYNDVVEQTRQMNMLIFATTLILLLFVLFASYAVSRKITTPIQTLNKAMLTVGKGEWIRIEASNTKDEIHELICGFNTMVENLMKLSADVAMEQEQKKKYEVSMINTQLMLLQSQINPHFIHNTLNAMKYLALKNNNPQLVEMISSFNSLLRSSMSYKEIFVTVDEESENLISYINIQKVRYDSDISIDFICGVEPDAADAILPKLILQPLVENALYHGIAPAEGGTISVHICVNDELLRISVKDDGVGMDNEILEEMLSEKSAPSRGDGQVGIENVNERLILHYGELSRLQIESTPNRGTIVSFTIPFITDEVEGL